MILSLLGIGFLLFGSASKCISNNNVDFNNIVNSVSNLRLNNPHNANDYLSVSGIYNFRDDYDYISFQQEAYDVDVSFEESLGAPYLEICPCIIDESLYFLKKIHFQTNGIDECIITFYVYNSVAANFTFDVYLDYGENLSTTDSQYKSLFFDYRLSMVLNGVQQSLFDSCFTHNDNVYTTSYSGYYNFLNGLSNFPTGFNLLGYLNFNNSIYFGFSNVVNGVNNNYIGFLNYNIETQNYGITNFGIPFNNNQIVSSNILISGSKMTKTSYNRLSSIGIFQYVRDTTYDDTDFHDLLFTIMDVPVYFISRFFNFELFGMNLAVAFAGLVTLAVMLFVIRIIWRLN